MRVEKGKYTIIAKEIDPQGKSDLSNGNSSGISSILKDVRRMDQIPEFSEKTPGERVTGEFGKSTITTAASEYTSHKKSKIHRGPDWKSLTTQALSRAGSSLSTKIRRMISGISSSAPVLNWKKELKKLFDSALKGYEWRIPNKRFVASGDYLYGRKQTGDSTFKTIIAAVDTSGSISKKQSELFLSEVQHLCKIADADILYIIYCSDDIDGVDKVRRGKKIDFSKWATTGGNSKGFIPPFKQIYDEKITPSVFIYFTDTGGDMPDPSKYGINKYKNKVIWFLATPEVSNPPPFGKSFWVPLSTVK